MAWEAFHRRQEVVRTAMRIVDERRDGVLPWREIPEAEAAFDSPEHLLRALQMRWHTSLAGAIERVLSEQPTDLEGRVVHAWRRCAARMPGVRAVLDAHSEVLTDARCKDWRLLAWAGIDSPGAVHAGERIEQRARSVTVDTTPPGSRLSRRAAWRSRLRDALVA